jgi:4,5-dihydroxyphthalate decarboxylase
VNVPVAFGCGLYDRMVPLYSGEVKADGIDLTFEPIDNPRDVFERMLAGKLDAAEMSMSDFIRRKSAGESELVAIPAFPSRVFRHGMICVGTASGIETPKDLEGRRIGVPLYAMTAAVWIRGILNQEYGVDFSRCVWVQDDPQMGPALAGGAQRTTVEPNTSGQSLTALLESGAIDAFIGADIPQAMRASAKVRRLFPNYAEVEREFFRRTRIFPIMHVAVIRRAFHERHPGVAASFYDALNRSKDRAREKMRYMGTLRYMLPWMIAEIEEIDAIFDGDPFVYGIEPNRPTIDALIGYLARESMLASPLTCDDLFVPV